MPFAVMACMMARVPTPEERFTIDVPEKGTVERRVRAARRCVRLARARSTAPARAWTTRSWPGFARAIADEGVATLRCNFPYMEAGKRSPDRQPVAVATVRAAFEAATERARRRRARLGRREVVRGAHGGGRGRRGHCPPPDSSSSGIRCIRPGKPERVRDEHLYGIEVPMLFLQGTKDPFATAAVLEPVLAKLADRDAACGRGRRALARTVAFATTPARSRASFAPLVAAFMRGERS